MAATSFQNKKGYMQNVIIKFDGNMRFLSNFARCKVTLPAETTRQVMFPELEFSSVENAYMAWKTDCIAWRNRIQAATPGQAKKMSRLPDFPLRKDYSDQGRLDIMKILIAQKFSVDNPEPRQKLLRTGDATIMEGNDLGDTFFGVCLNYGYGQNNLGRIIMEERRKIQSLLSGL